MIKDFHYVFYKKLPVKSCKQIFKICFLKSNMKLYLKKCNLLINKVVILLWERLIKIKINLRKICIQQDHLFIIMYMGELIEDKTMKKKN